VSSNSQLSDPYKGDAPAIFRPSPVLRLTSATCALSRGILCGFTAIISSKRLPPSVPKYNQHRVFLAQTVTEAVGLISCKITFQLYCTYCCTIQRYSEKYKHGEGKCSVDGIVTREYSNYGFGMKVSVESAVSLFLRTNKSHVSTELHSITLQAKCPPFTRVSRMTST
jgi:hypothetical protein